MGEADAAAEVEADAAAEMEADAAAEVEADDEVEVGPAALPGVTAGTTFTPPIGTMSPTW